MRRGERRREGDRVGKRATLSASGGRQPTRQRTSYASCILSILSGPIKCTCGVGSHWHGVDSLEGSSEISGSTWMLRAAWSAAHLKSGPSQPGGVVTVLVLSRPWHDAHMEYLDFEGVAARGRWHATASVRRFARFRRLQRAQGKLPQQLRRDVAARLSVMLRALVAAIRGVSDESSLVAQS